MRHKTALTIANRGSVTLCVLLAALVTTGSARAAFTDVTTASQIDHVHYATAPDFDAYQTYMSGGVAAGDFDNDGWSDLYFTRLDGSNLLYRNQGDGTFQDVTNAAFGANHLADSQSNGVAWGDVDNDGDVDLYVTSLATNRYHLFVNDGNGSFTEEATARGAAIEGPDAHYGQSVNFGDYDLDGYLDLYVTEWRLSSQNPNGTAQNSRLLRNAGAANPGHFVDVTQAAGVTLNQVQPSRYGFDSRSFTGRFADLDQDGLPELAVASDFGTSRLFWNNGDGSFTDGTDAAGVGTDQFGMGSTFGDIDGDGDLDWFVTSIYRPGWPTHDGNRLYRNDGNRVFTDITDEAGVRDGGWGWGAELFDYDNDGDLDLIEANGQNFGPPNLAPQSAGFEANPVKFWENDGSGVFTENAAALGLTDVGSGKGVATFDFDNDGDLDTIVVNNDGSPVLYRNDAEATNNWLRVKTVGNSSNADGLGAKITVTIDGGAAEDLLFSEVSGGSNFLSQSDPIAHFGLGDFSGNIDLIVIEWPATGIVQVIENVDANSLLTVFEPAAGLQGDFNNDGVVDASDYTVWRGHLNAPDESALHSHGDGQNGVDSADLLLWQSNYGKTAGSGGPLVGTATPEPSACLLLLTGWSLAIWRVGFRSRTVA